MCRVWIIDRLNSAYLNKSYQWLLRHSKAQLKDNILGRADKLLNQVLAPATGLFRNGVVVFASGGVLFYLQPAITVAGALFLLIPWIWLSNAVRPRFRASNQRSRDLRQAIFAKVDNIYGMSKEVKFYGTESHLGGQLRELLRESGDVFCRQQVFNLCLGRFLRFLFIAGAILLILALGELVGFRDLSYLLVYIGALLRLTASSVSLSSSWVGLALQEPALDDLLDDLASQPQNNPGEGAGPPLELATLDRITSKHVTSDRTTSDRLTLDHVTFQNVCFRYGDGQSWVFENLSCSLTLTKLTVIVGSSGVGKTTFVDLVCGLLSPNQGMVALDSVPLVPASTAWRRQLGYVSQDHPLADSTIAENIAWGHPESSLDRNLVQEAAILAEVHQEILALPLGYATRLEEGVGLSHGQLQRIALARALYRNPRLLVLDEATSYLDPQTEDTILTNLRERPDLKTLLITHRLANLCENDCVYRLSSEGLAPTTLV